MREKEINLVDFMIEILMHWRGMILMMLLGAMLLGSFSYVRSLPDISLKTKKPKKRILPQIWKRNSH